MNKIRLRNTIDMHFQFHNKLDGINLKTCVFLLFQGNLIIGNPIPVIDFIQYKIINF